MDNKVHEITEFWFEGVDDRVLVNKKNTPFKKWFITDRSFDDEIRGRFEDDLKKAAEGTYGHWEDMAEGALALILLFDQFSRNMYRNTPQMYAYDDKAAALSIKMIDGKKDKGLALIKRMFVYMPLAHAEDKALQQLSISCFQQLAGESRALQPENAVYYEQNLKYALEHCGTINKFGRFSHRDPVLKRKSTVEEGKSLAR